MIANPPLVPDPAGFAADWPGQRVVFADGAFARLAAEADRIGASRVLLIATPRDDLGARAAGLLGSRLACQWQDIRQHVPGDVADQVVLTARDQQADAVVAVGGGSATGLAKAVALETGLPVIAVPTTYAGSEMTPVWGRTQGGVKRTGRDQRVLPRTVIYDPDLLATLPAWLAGVSGMNALAHCVEAPYASLADPLTTLTSLEGARLIAGSLVAATQQADPAARRGLLWASCLAGRAFGTAGGSLHHSLCHLLGGAADLPHAPTHAIVLPQVVAFLAPVLSGVLPALAESLGTDTDDVAGAIWDLGAAAGTPAGLRALGLPAEQLPRLARALTDRNPPSPRRLSDEDARLLLAAAWRGERPEPSRQTPVPARIAGTPAAAPTAAEPLAAEPLAAEPLAAEPPSAEPMTVGRLTAEVVQRLQATPDPRLREVMTGLVRHLHGFVAEVGLSGDELLAGIGFLTKTGQLCSDTRQEFILLSDTLGVSMLVDLIAGAAAAGSAGHATESTVLGPFYVPGSPERPFGGSIAEQPAGEPAWFTGRVTSLDGEPITGAVLDVWQNADDMLYAVQNPDAPPGHLRGRFRTRADGSYAFLGVRPTDYPIPDDGPVGALLTATGRHPWRPAHIHLIVSAPGYRSVATHIFGDQSAYLDSDAVFAVKPSLVRHFERHEAGPDAPEGVPPGEIWYSLRYDFRLADRRGQGSPFAKRHGPGAIR
jgi:maleylacetate reductase